MPWLEDSEEGSHAEHRKNKDEAGVSPFPFSAGASTRISTFSLTAD